MFTEFSTEYDHMDETYFFFTFPERMSRDVRKEIACSILWFRNWSKNERKFFGRVLLEKEQNVSADTLGTLSNTMHRLTINSASCQEEPQEDDEEGPSLFECQLKTVMRWYKDWTMTERSEFINQINIIDSDIITSVNTQLLCHVRAQTQFVLR